MAANLAIAVAGLVVLLGSAWLVVHYASELTLRLGLSPMLVGATIVAFGTSAPELVVTVIAAAEGSDELAVGNVVGSNMANLTLVLGVAALLRPIALRPRVWRWELPVLGVATALLLLLAASGSLSRIEGAVMFALLIVYIAGSASLTAQALARRGRRLVSRAVREHVEPSGAIEELEPTNGDQDTADPAERTFPRRGAAILVVALLGLAAGAEMLVRGSTAIAEDLGISELVVGALLVAVGTSLPELATTAVASWRDESEIAIANAVGSSTFNLLGVLGAAAIVSPLTVDRGLYQFELPVLAIATVAIVPLARRGSLRRRDGALLIAGYTVFALVMLGRS